MIGGSRDQKVPFLYYRRLRTERDRDAVRHRSHDRRHVPRQVPDQKEGRLRKGISQDSNTKNAARIRSDGVFA